MDLRVPAAYRRPMAQVEPDASLEPPGDAFDRRRPVAGRAAAFVARLANLHAAFAALRGDPTGRSLPLDAPPAARGASSISRG
jgi:hypothetical protein